MTITNIRCGTVPVTSSQRWGLVAYRRRYHVPGPNSLWHIDGHHSLIRWRLVIHGGIDGWSRMIVYLWCSNNNRAESVHKLFLEAVSRWHLPSRVRADHGGENLLVKMEMEQRMGPARGSFIAGKSCHNSRIERLWRDVYYAVGQTFYGLFYYMESIGVLDPSSDVDIFCLHTIYLPFINRCLTEFTNAYSHHPIRTAAHKTPSQMWHAGIMDLANREQIGVQNALLAQDPEVVCDLYGHDPQAPIPDPEYDVSTVDVPVSALDLSQEVADRIEQFLPNFDIASEDYYLSSYSNARQYLEYQLRYDPR